MCGGAGAASAILDQIMQKYDVLPSETGGDNSGAKAVIFGVCNRERAIGCVGRFRPPDTAISERKSF